jgi:hypothetical protein
VIVTLEIFIIASYEKNTIYSNFFEPVNFKLSVYNLLIEYINGKKFLFFVERGTRKKIKEVIFLWENNTENSSLIFFLEILPRSTKIKNFSIKTQ